MRDIREYQQVLKHWHDIQWPVATPTKEQNQVERVTLKLGEEGAEVLDALLAATLMQSRIGKVMEAVVKGSQPLHPKVDMMNLGSELAGVILCVLAIAEYAGLDMQVELDAEMTGLPGFNWMDVYAPPEQL